MLNNHITKVEQDLNTCQQFLNTEYKKFNLDLPEAKTFEVDNNNIAFENKSSYDLDKALNLREFLNLWQKKLQAEKAYYPHI